MARFSDTSHQPPAAFLSAEWRHLLMLNFEVDPAVLTSRIPRGTELDLWNGRALVSMVGFMFLNTRVRGVAIPMHRNFEEINLRFYVVRETAEGVRRGVVFVKEIVPRWAIASVARLLYNENYVAHPTRHETVIPSDSDSDGRVAYEWRSGGRWHRLAATIGGRPAMAPDDSEESFITEHYWGYARQRDGSTVEYAVEHPRWKVWNAASAEFDCDVAALYGPEFAPFLSAEPVSAFVADGSEVVVRQGIRL